MEEARAELEQRFGRDPGPLNNAFFASGGEYFANQGLYDEVFETFGGDLGRTLAFYRGFEPTADASPLEALEAWLDDPAGVDAERAFSSVVGAGLAFGLPTTSALRDAMVEMLDARPDDAERYTADAWTTLLAQVANDPRLIVMAAVDPPEVEAIRSAEVEGLALAVVHALDADGHLDSLGRAPLEVLVRTLPNDTSPEALDRALGAQGP